MLKKYLIILILSIAPLLGQNLQFNADSAYQSIEHLSVTIGPRPMGSENETKALEWAQHKFESFGADTAYILQFFLAERRRDKLITKSGTAVGVLKGESDSSIVIGGHIDSGGPEIPGANDNASGASTVIELCRLWSLRPHHYTMVFCAFGGEEMGLLGSKHFVNNYPGIDDVVLMISADMGGTDSDIILMFETDSMQAPKWLVEDAYEVSQAINYNRLDYETQFSTLNNLSTNGAGSDHMSFLNKGIPALDFTSQVNDSPIHSPRDNMNFIDRQALGSYGNYIDHLLLKYQNGGIGSKSAGNKVFMLWQLAGVNIYLPTWFIITFIVIAFTLGGVAFVVSRNNRIIFDKSAKIKISGLKLFGLFMIVLIFSQLGDTVIQCFTGYRYPWMNHLGGYFLYDFIWAIIGLWIALQLTRIWKFSPDPYIYAKRALIVLFIFTIVSLILSPNLALYPAFMLVFFSIGLLIKNSLVKTVAILLSPILIIMLVFNEEFSWMVRSSAHSGFPIDSLFKALMINTVLVASLALLFLPMLNAYATLAATSTSIRKGLIKFRKPLFGTGLIVIVIGFGVYLGLQPAYNDMWRPSIHVDATYNLPEGKSELILLGNEYFKDVKVSGDTLMEFIDTRIHKADVPITFQADWIELAGSIHRQMIVKDSVQLDSVNYRWIAYCARPYLQLTFSMSTDTAAIIDPVSMLPFSAEENMMQYNFYGHSQDSLIIAGRFICDPDAKIIRKITGRYSGIPVDLQVESQLAAVRYRTTVQYNDTLTWSLNN